MCRTNDGFEIARVDMELRGPGDIEGTRQSGMLDLKVADLIKDEDLLETARLEAVKLLNADPDLLQEAHRPLLFKLVARQGGNIWNRVL
jgi:ATP-dependent DNA helicase RecG